MELQEVAPIIPGRNGRMVPLIAAALAFSMLLVTPFLAFYWYQLPFLGVLLEANNMVNQANSRGWPAHDAGVHTYDRLVELNDEPMRSPQQVMNFMRGNGVELVRARFARPDGSQYYIYVIPLPHFPFGDFFSLYVVPYLVGVVFMAIGLWAYNVRSDTSAGRVLLIYVSGVSMGVVGFFDLVSTNQTVVLWTASLVLTGASLMHLAMVFPQPLQVVVQRRSVLWLPWIVAAALAPFMMAAVISPSPSVPLDVASWRWGYLYMVASTLFFVAMLLYQVFFSSQPLIRQQSRVMVFGALIAFLPPSFYLAPLAFGVQSPFHAWLVFIPLVILPLSIAYSMLRYRLLDVDRFLGRALSYVITLGLALLGFYGVLFGLSRLLDRFLRSYDPLVTGSYLLLLVIAFQPLRTGVQRLINRLFYRAPADYRRVLTSLSQALVITPNLTQTLNLLESELWQALAPEKFVVYLYNDEQGEYLPHATREQSAPPYEVDDPLVRLLQKQPAPLWLPPNGPLPPELAGTLATPQRLAGYTFVPLRYEGRMIGFMSLGPRRSGVMYTRDDLDFLAAVAGQSTLALENARLFTNLRRNLDQTLEMKNMMDDIFSSMATGVITTDLRQTITLFNRAAEAILGVTVKRVLGKSLSQAVPGIGADLVDAAAGTLQNGESLLSAELNRTLPERGDLFLRLSVSPLRDARLETKGATFVFEDLTERRRLQAEQERIRQTFGRVVAPRVRDRLLADAAKGIRLDGLRQTVTILFADLNGFTPFSEGNEPEVVFSLLNSYLDLAAQAILEQEGTLDKFMGDALLAIWNSPDPQPDHALRAVRAACEIMRRATLAHQNFTDPARQLMFRIGLTTGPAMVGNVGTDQLFNYTAIGDTVNLAQRLQVSAERGQVLMEKCTYDIVAPNVLAVPLKPIMVKGRRHAVEVYELKGLS